MIVLNMKKALILICIFATAFAGPRPGSESCSRTCPDRSKFRYEVGTSYRFGFESDTITNIENHEQKTGTHIRATADVEIIGPCELALHIHDAELLRHSNGERVPLAESEQFAQDLERFPLRFAFHDGRVDSICPSEDDKVWVLNIKRSILTAFQNNMEHFRSDASFPEVDITGHCTTHYKVSHRGVDSFTITKTKDISGCRSRHGNLTSLHALPYRVSSEYQSLPLIQSTHNCEQTIHSEGYLLTAVCKESHTFKPLKRGSAVTNSEQRLTFKQKINHPHNNKVRFGRRSSLLWEHTDVPRSSVDKETVMDHVRALCRQTHDDYNAKVPRMFAQLIEHLKGLDTETMRAVHQESMEACEHSRHYIHDAIPMVGTTPSVTLIKEMINNNHLGRTEKNKMLASIQFIPRPTTGMLVEMKQLLNSDPTRNTIMSVSALVHRYCHRNPNCAVEPEVTDIVSILESFLGDSCSSKSDKVLAALKAIGNIGHGVRAIETIQNCAKTSSSVPIRLSALDSLRRVGCHVSRQPFLDMFNDMNEDSEIRIAAYQAAMKCPNQEMINKVKEALEKEKVNQVGSYVWSHLSNMMETQNPHKAEIRKILKDEVLRKEFDLEKAKFSRHFEKSFFNDKWNVGGNVEGNLIFSQKSFVPRSGNLNMSVDLFGQSVNLLELGGRLEGIEEMAEQYFGDMGPRGRFSRPRRSTINSIKKGSLKYSKSPKTSGFMKIFGTEMSYFTEEDFSMERMREYMMRFMKMSDKNMIDFSKSLQFIDTEYVIPTISGLPVRLNINGTATIHLNVSAKFHNDGGVRKLSGHFCPSGAVEINARMSSDAHYVRSGFSVVNSIHSNFAAKGSVTVTPKQTFKLSFDLPKAKNDIFQFSHKMFADGQELKEKYPGKSFNKCSGEKLQKIADLKLCASANMPNNYWGPASFGISLQKTDPQTSYLMELSSEKQDGKTICKFILNTPNSEIDRQISWITTKGEGIFTSKLRTPWKTVEFAGTLSVSETQRSMTAHVKIDGEKSVSLTSNVGIKRTAVSSTYTPNINLYIPGRDKIGLTGKFHAVPRRELKVELALTGLSDDPMAIDGKVQRIPNGRDYRYNLHARVSSGPGSFSLTSFFDNKLTTKSHQTTVKYRWGDQEERTFSVALKKVVTRSENRKSVLVTGNVRNSVDPSLNIALDVNNKYYRAKRKLDSQITVSFGNHPVSNDDKLKIKTVFQYLGPLTVPPKQVHFTFDSSITYPRKDINWVASLNHKHSESKVTSTGSIKSNDKVLRSFAIKMNDESSNEEIRFVGSATFFDGTKRYALTNNFNRRRTRRSLTTFSNTLSTDVNGKQATISGEYTPDKENSLHSVQLLVRIPDQEPTSLYGKIKTVNPIHEINLVGKAEQGSKVYEIGVTHLKKSKSVTCDLRLVTPSRTIKGSNKISFEKDFILHTNVAWSPEKSINVLVSTKRSDRDASLSVDIKNPWNPVSLDISGTLEPSRENAAINVNLDLTRYSGGMSFDLSMPRGSDGQRSFSLSSSVSFSRPNSSPFHNQMSVSYNLRTEPTVSFSSNMKMDHNRRSIFSLEGIANYQDRTFESRLSGSLMASKSASLTFDHKYIGSGCQSKLVASLMDKTISAALNLNPRRTAGVLNGVAGDMTIKTPFSGYETMSGQWDCGYTNGVGIFFVKAARNSQQVSSKLKLDISQKPWTGLMRVVPLNGKPVEVSGSFEHRNTGFIDGSVKFISPFTDPVTVEVKFNPEQKPYKVRTIIGYLGTSMELDFIANHRGYKFVDLEAKLAGYGETANTRLTYDISSKPYTGLFEIQLENEAFIRIDTSLNHKSWKSADFEIKMLSPISPMSFSTSYNLERSGMVSVMGKLGESKHVSGESKWKISSGSVYVEGSLKGSNNLVKPSGIKAEINWMNKPATARLSANVGDTKVNFKSSFSMDKNKIETSFTMTSPLPTMGMTVVLKNNPYTMDISSTYGPHLATLNGNFNYVDVNTISTETSFKWPNTPKVRFSFERKGKQNILAASCDNRDITVTATVDNRGLRFVDSSLSWQSNGLGSRWYGQPGRAGFSYNVEKMPYTFSYMFDVANVNADAKYEFEVNDNWSKGSYISSVTMSGKVAGSEKIVWNVAKSPYELLYVVSSPNGNFNFKTKLREDGWSSVSGSVEGSIRMAKWSPPALKASTSWNFKNHPFTFNFDGQANYNHLKIISSTRQSNNWNTMSMETTIKSSMGPDFVAELKWNKESSPRTFAFKMMSGSDAHIKITGDWAKQGVAAFVMLLKPTRIHAESRTELSFDIYSNRKTLSMDIECTPGNTVSLGTTFEQRNWRYIDASLTYETPFRTYKKFTTNFNFNVEKPEEGYTTSLDTTWGNKELKLSSYCKVKKNEVSANLMMKIPGYEQITYIHSTRYSPMRADVDSSVTYGERKIYSFNGLAEREGSRRTFNFDLVTPMPKLEKIKFGFISVNEENLKTLSTFLNVPEKRVEFDGKWTPKTLSIKMNCPCRYLNGIDFNYEFSGKPSDFRTTVNFNHSLLSSPMSSVVSWKNLENKFEGGLTISSSFQNFEGSFRHTIDGSEHSNIGSIALTPSKQPSGFSIRTPRKITWDTSLNAKSLLQFEARMNVKSPIGPVSAVVEINAPLRKYIDAKLGFNMGSEKFECILKSSTADNEPLNLIVNTPFRKFMKGWAKITTDSLYRSEIGFQSSESKYFSELSLNNNPIRAVVKVGAPGINLDVNFKHQGHWRKFETSLTGTYGTKTINIDLNSNNFGPYTGKLNIRMPENKFVTLDWNQENRGTYFTQKINFNSHFFTLKQTTELMPGSFTFDRSVSVGYPRNIRIKATYSGPVKNFNGVATVEYGNEEMKKFEIKGRTNINSEASSVESSIFHTDKGLAKFTANGQLENGWKKFSGNAKASYGPHNVDFTLGMDNTQSSFTGEISLKASNGKYFSYSWNHEQKDKIYFTRVITLKTNYGDWQQKLDILPGSYYLRQETSLYKPKLFEVSVKHSGPIKKFNGQITMKADERVLKFKASSDISKQNRNIQLLASCSKMGEARLDLLSKRTQHSLDANANLQFGSKQVSVTGMMKNPRMISGRPTVFALGLRTPYNNFKDFSIRLDKTRNRGSNTGKLTVLRNGVKLVDLEGKLIRRPGSYAVSAKTNFPRPMSASYNLEKRGSSMSLNYEVNWDGRNRNSNAQLNIRFSSSGRKGSQPSFDRKVIAKLSVPRDEPIHRLNLEGVVFRSSHNLFSSFNGVKISNGVSKKIGYEIDLLDATRGSERNYIGELKLVGLMRKIASTIKVRMPSSSKVLTSMHFSWDVEKNKFISIEDNFSLDKPGFFHFTNELVLNSHLLKTEQRFVLQHYTNTGDKLFYVMLSNGPRYVSVVLDKKLKSNYTLSVNYKYGMQNYMEGKFSAHADLSSRKSSIGMHYSTKAGGWKDTIYAKAAIDTVAKRVLIDFFSPMRSAHLYGKINTKNPYMINVQTHYHGRTYRTVISVDTVKCILDAKFYYDQRNPDNYYCIKAKYVNSKAIAAEAYRSTDGQVITDASLALRLNNSRLLHGKMYWRPEALEELKSMVSLKNAQLMRRIVDIQQEFQTGTRKYQKFMEKENGPVFAALRSIRDEVNFIGKELNELASSGSKMYQRNEFYIRSIVDLLKSLADSAVTASEGPRRVVRSVASDSSNFFGSIWNTISHHTSKAAEKILHHGKQVVKDVVNKVTEHEYYQQASKWLGDLTGSVVDSETVALYNKRVWNEYGGIMKEKIKGYLNQIRHQIRPRLRKYQGRIFELMRDPRVLRAVTIIRTGLEQTKWFADYYDIPERFADIARTVYNESRSQMKYYDPRRLFKNTKFTVLKPDQGEVQFEVALPIDVNALDELPEVNLEKKINYMKYHTKKIFNRILIKPAEFFAFKPKHPMALLPPYPGHASIAGSQHFVTFDHKDYQFRGTCSYVLAKDVVSNRFTISMNYARKNREYKKQSITVETENKNIEVLSDLKVKIDGRQTELPVRFGNVVITRCQYKVNVMGKGFKLKCNEDNFCMLKVSPWMFGKVRGLLGTFDNEQYNDMTKPDGSVTEDVSEFVKSWAVGQCNHMDRTHSHPETEEGDYAKRNCGWLFKCPASPFRGCFRKVDPMPFYKKCLADKAHKKSGKSYECASAIHYVAECRQHHISLILPKSCHACEEKTIQDQEVPQTADVVFLVEERSCNNVNGAKLNTMATRLDAILREKGVTNNRFAIVGFGGSDIHERPKHHTINGQIFSPASTFERGTKLLTFSDSPKGNYEEAIKRAVGQRFRTGAKKIIIMTACNDCQLRMFSSWYMPDMANEGISFHLIMNGDVDNNDLFGYDNKLAFTRNDVARLTGNEEMRGDLKEFSSRCAGYAHSTNGSIFFSNRLTESDKVSKEFMDVFALRVARDATPASCQICSCVKQLACKCGKQRQVCRPC